MASNEVTKESKVEGLANFYAYANGAIKVIFVDRTILRMQKGSDALRILDCKGNELVFSLSTFRRSKAAMQ
jgi:hypothetical protein